MAVAPNWAVSACDMPRYRIRPANSGSFRPWRVRAPHRRVSQKPSAPAERCDRLVPIDPLEHGSERIARGCLRTGSSCRALPQFLQHGCEFFSPPCDVKPSRILRALHAADPDLLSSCRRLFRNHQHRRNPVLVGVGALADGTVLVHLVHYRSRASFGARSRKIQGARRVKGTSCLLCAV